MCLKRVCNSFSTFDLLSNDQGIKVPIPSSAWAAIFES